MAQKKRFRTKVEVPELPVIDESLLSLFDPDNPDINLFNLIDEEATRLGGSKLYVYKFYRSEDYDEVYMEAPNKTIAREPLVLFGHYEPLALDENLSEYGIELTSDQLFVFNKSYAERILGRPLIAGDVIKPMFQDQRYEVFEVQEDSFEAYGVYHLNCHARLLRDSSDVQNEPLTDTSDDIGGYGG